ncbi:hypothetical protein [Bradyrhizobium sp. NAS96.2]|uniref:hypothetical protein n=1 Tax=Bradyrhizobium sp. NAS96.2 TaxID=1680160 RepID=UPI00093C5290|nr:hypothetical protein [Bradyrhizobium sp. NAS96.2]
MQSRIYSVDQVQIENLIVIPEHPPAIAVSASGSVTTSGWTQPDLAPWMYITPPADGILDLDFVATPPTGIVLQVISRISVVKTFAVPGWLKGIRVHSSQNTVEAMLQSEMPAHAVAMEGWPLPWPFPWWSPKSK